MIESTGFDFDIWRIVCYLSVLLELFCQLLANPWIKLIQDFPCLPGVHYLPQYWWTRYNMEMMK